MDRVGAMFADCLELFAAHYSQTKSTSLFTVSKFLNLLTAFSYVVKRGHVTQILQFKFKSNSRQDSQREAIFAETFGIVCGPFIRPQKCTPLFADSKFMNVEKSNDVIR